jgi:sarcosine oxidase subunit gamma
MKTVFRRSPICDELQPLNVTWREMNGMSSPATIDGESTHLITLGIADVSFLNRFGVKGTEAATWLQSHNLPIPEFPNRWLSLPEGGLIARLGFNEFLIEDSMTSHVALQLTELCQQLPKKVYPVLRQDAAIALCGSRIHELLCQTCNINFRSLDLAEQPIILTSMIGVSVTIIPGEQVYRMWCDGTFGAYVWRTLLEIAQELGGGAVGFERVLSL